MAEEEEERRVSERLERIEGLRRGRAGRGALLAELRGLLREGEAWLAGDEKAATGETDPLVGRGRDPAGKRGGGAEGVERPLI